MSPREVRLNAVDDVRLEVGLQAQLQRFVDPWDAAVLAQRLVEEPLGQVNVCVALAVAKARRTVTPCTIMGVELLDVLRVFFLLMSLTLLGKVRPGLDDNQ